MSRAGQSERPFRVFLIAGEDSGDQLGARLMEALIRATGGAVTFTGVGGIRMRDLGLSSLFPMDDLSVMGITAVLGRLPLLLRRIRETADAVVEARPDVVVIIDAPDFTHRVAQRVRKALPELPVVAYVSPTVWAWRPGRARRMASFVDHLLAILPFEPDIHARLGGPPTTYVGHPLVDRPDLLLPAPGERPLITSGARPDLLLLPGSRGGEIARCLPDLAGVDAELRRRGLDFRAVIPAVARHEGRIRDQVSSWPVPPLVVSGEAAKFAAFRAAHAAVAVSGTVSLELALAGVPTVVLYRRDPLFRIVTEIVRRIPGQVQVDSMVLANIILGERVIPEFLDAMITPGALADALAPLMAASEARARQLDATRRLWDAMRRSGVPSAADMAAGIVLRAAR